MLFLDLPYPRQSLSLLRNGLGTISEKVCLVAFHMHLKASWLDKISGAMSFDPLAWGKNRVYFPHTMVKTFSTFNVQKSIVPKLLLRAPKNLDHSHAVPWCVAGMRLIVRSTSSLVRYLPLPWRDARTAYFEWYEVKSVRRQKLNTYGKTMMTYCVKVDEQRLYKDASTWAR